jgi:mono/diheme cytochrome c family protein
MSSPSPFRLSVPTSSCSRALNGALALLVLSSGAAFADAASDANANAKKAHAVLADNCLSCHGAAKQAAGLRLDTREGILKGAESGPVVVDNDPAKSSLAQVLSHTGEVRMPPKAKLKAEDIAAIEGWIRNGFPLLGAGAAPVVAKEKEKGAETKLDPAVAEFFETQVRPVLANSCYGCHGPDKQMAALRLDSKAALLKGSDNGPVVVPGDPDKSVLIQAVRHSGAIKMPAGKGKLPPGEIEALETWVKMGVPWPGGEVSAAALAAAKSGEYTITPEQRSFWSFQPVRSYAPPKVKTKGWASSPIDLFVLAKLEARGLSPSKPADRRTLIRRATYDLHGLAPTPTEVDAFVKDTAPDAWAKVVDRLLASPRYGEKWGRHWLDIARYADTKGYVFVEDRRYEHAYNYRDWVIRAFNEDLPYDQFIVQQLAADRLLLQDAMGDPRPLAAMGFLRVGRRFLNQQPDIIDDRIDTTMRGFQGLSTACARCHDHKFDPIPAKDYYSLYGVFANSVEPDPVPISPREISAPWQAHDQKVRDAKNQHDGTIRAQVKRLREMLARNESLPDEVKSTLGGLRENDLPNGDQMGKLEPSFEASARESLKSSSQNLEDLRKSYPRAPERAMTMADAPKLSTQHIFKRGNPGNRGEEAPRRFHAILSSGERPVWDKSSGRLELAQAIASKENPLTARVMVNRLWQHHFGAGIVRTPSDFGTRGDKPTHPELLDYLARQFMDGGWSLKKMHRSMMLSSTYKQSSGHNPKYFPRDPENLLLWRMNRRRLEFEDLRDSLLAAAGKLDATVGGPSVDLWQAPYSPRRAVYGTIERQNLPGIFRTFDFANPDSSSAQRFRTTVPQQALFLMNAQFVVEQAKHVASLPEVLGKADDAAQVRTLYYRLFGRTPSAQELALAQKYLQLASAPPKSLVPTSQLWSYGYGSFDEAAKRVASFTPFSTFKNNVYQAHAEMPHASVGWVQLTPTGGHTGKDAQHAAIRRWTAPQYGVVLIKGKASHPSPNGDGVELRIVSSRAGLLGAWTVQNSQAETIVEKVEVKRGDTIDFITSCRANDNSDSFGWSAAIVTSDNKNSWDSTTGFKSPPPAPQPPLKPLERYAQVLLMTNEFFFVD